MMRIASALLMAGLVVGMAAAPAIAAEPVNGRIAYVDYDDGDGEIVTVNPDGTGRKQLTTNSVRDWQPEWSPNGKKVVFARLAGSGHDLYVIKADGSGERALATGSDDDRNPSWSPDGTQIVFTRHTGSEFDLWVMNADGTDKHALIATDEDEAYPAWSSTGQLAFSRYTATVRVGTNGQPEIIPNWELYSANANGSGVARLTNNTTNDTDGSWRAGGGYLLFTLAGSSDPDIYEYDGGAPVGLITGSGKDRDPDASPVDNALVYTNDDPVSTSLVQVHDQFGTRTIALGDNPSWGAGMPTCKGLPATILGTPGNDTLTGTSGDDVIVGLDGNDTIEGMGGKDLLCGGTGNDDVKGNGGGDTMEGGPGDDVLRGGLGVDSLSGQDGNDDLAAKDGVRDAAIKGGPGTDTATRDAIDPPAMSVP